ncbi:MULTISPECIES: transporter [unclassified Pseudomonas]|uniref:transporter n=1 Tax=unclassified Pseudomonas TaxID=196821 RepID=UPI000BC3B679|nr:MULTISPECIES: transporter [unclassified Pseudomonas]PVZ15427.1 zinc transporter [Pseudomonas sp. URIL14HWK12:I12]PVZ24801.1 zinc transporter [Pseudomonas sp. URIL14HWK12:I10]PVZ34647.1 zinc transporter [Pseudomonas sp. URIL14HWK12:I11]SNZ08853.1 zinc transporter [Pseudomonas sp. URIL14HWK12:I9]
MQTTLAPKAADADPYGLICGFRFRAGLAGDEMDAQATLHAVQNLPVGDEFIWVHLNMAHAGCKRWMLQHLDLPEYFFETLSEGSRSTRLEHVEGALTAVVNDVVFRFGEPSSDIATLWLCVRENMLVSVRLQPLRSADRLRFAVKRGETFDSPLELLEHLIDDQAEILTQMIRDTHLNVDRIEDQLLSQRLTYNRAELSGVRRTLVRMQRLLALEPNSLMRLLNRPPRWFGEEEVQALRSQTEEFSRVIHDLAALLERIKLIQEEITALQNEQTNRTLFTLTLVTVLALPINIVAGFFGMNVGGIPLSGSPHGFWILVVIVASFTLLAGRLAFRKRTDTD